MGDPDPIPPQAPQDQGRAGHDPVVHGSRAAIAAAIFAGLAMIGTFATAYVNRSNRSDQKTQQAKTEADTHTNSLIEAKVEWWLASAVAEGRNTPHARLCQPNLLSRC